MSDRFPAEITIGGNIPIAILPELAQKIAESGVSVTFGDNYLSFPEVTDMIEEANKNKETVSFCDDQARGGMFDELESFLRKNKIDFDRNNDAYCQYDAEVLMCRNGEDYTFTGDQQGYAMLDRNEVIRAMDKAGEEGPEHNAYYALMKELERITGCKEAYDLQCVMIV